MVSPSFMVPKRTIDACGGVVLPDLACHQLDFFDHTCIIWIFTGDLMASQCSKVLMSLWVLVVESPALTGLSSFSSPNRVWTNPNLSSAVIALIP